MADAISVSGPISGTDKTLSFETGKLAGLSNGAVTARIGSTQVLVTATASSKPRDGADFFPLTVDIEERLETLREVSGEIREVESALEVLRATKWEIVEELKGAGHDFTASTEGMDVVLSAPPSMRF